MMQTENILNDSRLRALENHTRVNLLRPTLGTTTINGVTCTNNGDGTYTLNGTATANTWFNLGFVNLTKGTYKLVGTPLDRVNSFMIEDTNYRGDYGHGTILEIDSDSRLKIDINVVDGTYNNVVYKPMITDDLSATYDDFVSYEDSLQPGINTGLKMDLLWTNASPTSAFAGQTVILPKYNQYAIIVLGATYSKHSQMFFVRPGAVYVIAFPNYKNGVIGQRALNIVTDEFAFGNGYSMDSYHTQTENDSVSIPYRIYGVK